VDELEDPTPGVADINMQVGEEEGGVADIIMHCM
jgi:hypothetical protein